MNDRLPLPSKALLPIWKTNDWAVELAMVAALVGDAPTVRPSMLTGWHRSVLLDFERKGWDLMLETMAPHERTNLAVALVDYRAATPKQFAKAIQVVHSMDSRRRKAAELLVHLEACQQLISELQ